MGGAPIVAWEAIGGVQIASAVEAVVGYSTRSIISPLPDSPQEMNPAWHGNQPAACVSHLQSKLR